MTDDKPRPPAWIVHFFTAVIVLTCAVLSLAALVGSLGTLVLAVRWLSDVVR